MLSHASVGPGVTISTITKSSPLPAMLSERENDSADYPLGNIRGEVYVIMNPRPAPQSAADTTASTLMPGLKLYAYAIATGTSLRMKWISCVLSLAVLVKNTLKHEVKYGWCVAEVGMDTEVGATLCKRSHAIFRAGMQLYTNASVHDRMYRLLLRSADIEARKF
jgi:hypothetical protein